MSSELYCSTKRNTYVKILRWDVFDLDWHFDLNNLAKFGSLSSPVYGVDNQGEKLEWRIHMCGENSRGMFSSPKWVSISLEYLGRSDKSRNSGIKCKYSIQVGANGDKDKESCFSVSDRQRFSLNAARASLRLSFDEFLKKRQILFPENTLRITVQLEVDGKPLHTGNSKSFSEDSSLPSASFPELLYNKKFSDVTISCEGKTFPAHKILLAHHSNVFAKMLSNVESVHEIPINDLRPETVKDMLQYIYTGAFDKSQKWEHVLRLLECASRFELNSLKSACFQQLSSSLTDDNIGEICLAGHVFHVDEKMRQACKDYCRRRHCQLINNSKFRKSFVENVDAFI
ncbi:unnamed protein product [Allacma fusca]|uniref:BTB domain-containing protein n=1 Tax=Allacma fusca TaxID=39272 RepID=A0A8J2PLF0_9HEXA|nr:unnamed protein product [Allacma fusca]